MRLKVFFISLFSSIILCFGINVLGGGLESFFYSNQIIDSPQLLTASINQEMPSEIAEIVKKSNDIFAIPEDFDVEAKAVISVKISNNGEEKVLFEKNPTEMRAIASLTKLMTVLVVFDLKETYDLEQAIILSRKATTQEGEPKYSNFRPGEQISVKNLIYASLIASSNNAAFALTELVGEEAFVDLMNFYAKDIGLENTYFFNSTGLEPDDIRDPKNYSTVEDLVKLAKYILEKYPQIFEITKTNSCEIVDADGCLNHFIPENTNKLLIEFPQILGGKTGLSPAAQGCLLLVLQGQDKDSYFINVVLGSENRFGEMKKIIEQVNKIKGLQQ